MTISAVGLFALALALPITAPPILEEDACPQCKRTVQKDWNFCPIDGVNLKAVCPKCKASWGKSWKFCPEDGAPLGKEGTAAKGETRRARGPISVNTPAGVLDEFVDALGTGDRKLLDGLIHWDSYYGSHLSRKNLDQKEMSMEAFQKLVHQKFLSEEIQKKVKGMVKSNQDGNTFTIVGDNAKFQLTLVSPTNSTQRISNTFDIRLIDRHWRITDIN